MDDNSKCESRINQLKAMGMGIADGSRNEICKGINALSDDQFQQLLEINNRMNSPAGQPLLGYGFGFQNRAYED